MDTVRGPLDDLLGRCTKRVDNAVVTVPTGHLLRPVVEIAHKVDPTPRILVDRGLVAEIDWYERARLTDLDGFREGDVQSLTVRGEDEVALIDVDDSAAVVAEQGSNTLDRWAEADPVLTDEPAWSDVQATVTDRLGAEAGDVFEEVAGMLLRGKRSDPVSALLWAGARTEATVNEVRKTVKGLGVGGDRTVTFQLDRLEKHGVLSVSPEETETVGRRPERLQTETASDDRAVSKVYLTALDA